MEILARARTAAVCSWGKDPQLVTPTYFPALSSVATGARVADLLDLIAEIGYPRVLVSSYDVWNSSSADRARLKSAARTIRSKGNLVFMDSGVYESFWRADNAWSYDEFATTARGLPSDIYTTYDGAVHRHGTASSKGYSANHVTSSMALKAGKICLAIVHGETPTGLEAAVKDLVAANLGVDGIAVPERECGANIYERIKTVHSIRQILGQDPRPVLHVLGCGHPQAIAGYVLAGADSFDSLDWMQVALDPLRRSYTDLAMVGSLGCTCAVCKTISADNLQRALLHNLRYYQDYMQELQRAVRQDTLKDQVLEFLGKPGITAAGA